MDLVLSRLGQLNKEAPNPPGPLPTLLRVEDFAAQWGLSRTQAYHSVNSLPPGVRVMVGRRLRINADAYRDWLAAGGSLGHQNLNGDTPK